MMNKQVNKMIKLRNNNKIQKESLLIRQYQRPSKSVQTNQIRQLKLKNQLTLILKIKRY